jgi:hypothetical protein
MVDQRQLNVNLPAELVRECKHAAIDADMSLGAFVAEALQRHLADIRRLRTSVTGSPNGGPDHVTTGR